MSAPWMPFYVADYLADTGHLSTVEHGAYMLLIMHYWQKGGLPDDDKQLARICRMPGPEWASIRDTLAGFFDSGWRHGRIDDELTKAEELLAKRSAAGKAGASARYGKGMANAQQTNSHSQPPLDKYYSRGEIDMMRLDDPSIEERLKSFWDWGFKREMKPNEIKAAFAKKWTREKSASTLIAEREKPPDVTATSSLATSRLAQKNPLRRSA